jgi:WXG100 family type VII secretion target
MSGFLKFQAQYSQLKQIAQKYQQLADQATQMQSQVKGGVDNLTQSWEGKGATAFFGEMNDLVFPGIDKLHTAMEQAAQITAQVAQTIQQAEEDAKNQFKF